LIDFLYWQRRKTSPILGDGCASSAETGVFLTMSDMPESFELQDSSEPTFASGDGSLGSQLRFELDFYDGILQRDPNYVDVLKVMGKNLCAHGDYVRASDVDRRITHLCPSDELAHYNLACSLGMAGGVDAALDALQRSLELGYRDFMYLREDRDLEPIRKDPRFVRLLDEYVRA
jgi:hypothetical protein